ncbi:MAG TPA: glycosyltransferase family 4 protein [Kineosporiaceae bacterium]|nr:glycosyltransferase family 4 protein [Kineosporiaceae bacterium]
MRITFVITNAYGLGGTIRTTLTMASALAERHDVQVVSVLQHLDDPLLPVDPRVRMRVLVNNSPTARTRRRTSLNPMRQLSGLTHSALGRLASRLAHPKDVRYGAFSVRTDLALIKFVRSMAPGDVVVATRPSLNLILARYAPPGVIAIGQEHMHLDKHGPELRASFLRLYPRLDAMVTLTEADAQAYRKLLGPAAKVYSVPNAVPDVGQVRAALDPDTKVVVAAGRLTRQKGFDRLVAAWAIVARKHPDWRLNIFGHGNDVALQARIDKKKLTDVVTLQGFTNEPYQRFAESAIYAMSSRSEGFPMVLLEAMGCGLPLVSFDCQTGPADIIKDGKNGLLVPDGDIKALAAALNRLIEDPELRRQMGAVGVEQAKEYAPDRIVARWEHLFEELQEAPRRRAGGAPEGRR